MIWYVQRYDKIFATGCQKIISLSYFNNFFVSLSAKNTRTSMIKSRNIFRETKVELARLFTSTGRLLRPSRQVDKYGFKRIDDEWVISPVCAQCKLYAQGPLSRLLKIITV